MSKQPKLLCASYVCDPQTNSGPAALQVATSLAAGAGPLFLPEAVECLPRHLTHYQRHSSCGASIVDGRRSVAEVEDTKELWAVTQGRKSITLLIASEYWVDPRLQSPL